MKQRYRKTIKNQITFVSIAFILTLTIMVASIYSYTFQKTLRRNLVQSSEVNLQMISYNISTDMKELIYFSKWCGLDLEILDFLQTPAESDSIRTVSSKAYNHLNNQYRNTRASTYVKRLIISTGLGNFLQIVNSTSDGSMTSASQLEETRLFQTLHSNEDYLWVGIVEDPLSREDKSQIIPIIRPVYNSYNSEKVGWTHLAISSKIITDYITNYTLHSESMMFVTIGDHTYQLVQDQLIPLEEDFKILRKVTGLTLDPSTEVNIIKNADGKEQTLVTRSIDINYWSLSQVISDEVLASQRQVYYYILAGICFLVIALGAILTVYINRTINLPITAIQKKMSEISHGNFSPDSSIEWEHELGEIGKGINILSKDILHLLEKRVDDEKQKKDLEYQMLQNQINPHFLYNTLNSIKWMATIQNATGIAEMTTSLSRLLKSISKGTSQIVSLRDEISLLKDYFIIQQYRYGSIVTMEFKIESERVYDCKILRFTLQPIVENALFHGIEPKGIPGQILIHIYDIQEKELYIDIIDDGIGMSEETGFKVLSDQKEPTSEFFKKIGISNVHRRIQYEFGEAYGIHITSKLGIYTKMSIKLPYNMEEQKR